MHDRSCRAMGRELGLSGEWIGRRLREALEWLGADGPPPGSRRRRRGPHDATSRPARPTIRQSGEPCSSPSLTTTHIPRIGRMSRR